MSYHDIYDFNGKTQLALEFSDLKLSGFNPEFCGMEETAPSSCWGPGYRSQYHLHFVINGKGIFENSSQRYELSPSQGFFFAPGKRIYYESDSDNPWVYIWFAFTGNDVNKILRKIGISTSNPVFTFENSINITEEFAKIEYMKSGREFYAFSVLMRLFSSLDTSDLNIFVPKAEIAANYIVQNISNAIFVKSIADYLNIDRRYFSKLFKKSCGISPQQFIMNTRMSIALSILKEKKNISISDVARSVGYNDVLAFSKAFKKYFNSSPSEVSRGKLNDLTAGGSHIKK